MSNFGRKLYPFYASLLILWTFSNQVLAPFQIHVREFHFEAATKIIIVVVQVRSNDFWNSMHWLHWHRIYLPIPFGKITRTASGAASVHIFPFVHFLYSCSISKI